MNVGDLVRCKKKPGDQSHKDWGVGVLVDVFEDQVAHVYFEVEWINHEGGWWHTLELELISEAR
tara:strand:- start:2319 stop:2510 length:192 start_codon:yes stop_codon:yes gene_type:complete